MSHLTLSRPATSDRVTLNGSPVSCCVNTARDYLLGLQNSDGHWCGELEGDTILASEFVLTYFFLGLSDDSKLVSAASSFRHRQLPEGGWSLYPGGPLDPSASVKAYFVLKLVGDAPESTHMIRARAAIRQAGGVEACNTFTKIYLALFGQYPWRRCPAVPPEMMLLPEEFWFNIHAMSSWSRAIVVPLSIIWAHRPVRAVPPEAGIAELYVRSRQRHPVNAPTSRRGRLWFIFFRGLDRLIKLAERHHVHPLRHRALELATRWMLDHLKESDGLGAIFPPIINSIIALTTLGYAADHPVVTAQRRILDGLVIDEAGAFRVQPCHSPVWDTSLTLASMQASGLPPNHPDLQRAGSWLLKKEVTRAGDWQRRVPDGTVGGWFFEYENAFYPDVDDTAEVLLGLARLRFESAEDEMRRRSAIDRGLSWMLAMQNEDGGWASFDRGCDDERLTWVPFADHNAMIDPSTVDITGRVLIALEANGFDHSHRAVQRGASFIRQKRATDGTWFGRWGCNYIYGTWLALSGLKSAGEDLSPYDSTRVWLVHHQNDDGGWGETPRSYDDILQKGIGPSTAAQTAWALLALHVLCPLVTPPVRRGLQYLLHTQRPDGSWQDEPWTGTGFPRVFYLRYHLYATYFPLLALAAWHQDVSHP